MRGGSPRRPRPKNGTSSRASDRPASRVDVGGSNPLSSMHAAWYGQQLLGVGGRYRVHVSRERALESGAEEGAHVREPRRPGVAYRLADPVGGFG